MARGGRDPALVQCLEDQRVLLEGMVLPAARVGTRIPETGGDHNVAASADSSRGNSPLSGSRSSSATPPVAGPTESDHESSEWLRADIVRRIADELGPPAVAAVWDDAHGVAAGRHSGGVFLRPPGDDTRAATGGGDDTRNNAVPPCWLSSFSRLGITHCGCQDGLPCIADRTGARGYHNGALSTPRAASGRRVHDTSALAPGPREWRIPHRSVPLDHAADDDEQPAHWSSDRRSVGAGDSAVPAEWAPMHLPSQSTSRQRAAPPRPQPNESGVGDAFMSLRRGLTEMDTILHRMRCLFPAD